ncbi:MAG TPA: BrnT family toxin [Rhizobiaceae bacterium]|nr:BrnT family toxin [Rhizobiaceae bacterium]
MLKFEWDETKARKNLRKHGVSFDDAARALRDMSSVELRSEVDDGEFRSLWLAMGPRGVLAIVFTDRDDRIRITSARKANRYEEAIYTGPRQI